MIITSQSTFVTEKIVYCLFKVIKYSNAVTHVCTHKRWLFAKQCKVKSIPTIYFLLVILGPLAYSGSLLKGLLFHFLLQIERETEEEKYPCYTFYFLTFPISSGYWCRAPLQNFSFSTWLKVSDHIMWSENKTEYNVFF